MDGLTSRKIIQNPCMNLLRKIKPRNLVGFNHVKMNRTMEPGAWWLEKSTNDVIRIISRENAYSLTSDPPEGSVIYEYFTDDANRGVSHKQCVATPDELMATFTYKMN